MISNRVTLGILAAVFASVQMVSSAENRANILWEIGKADSSMREFALAPNGYQKFSADALFVVGRTKTRDAWPYCHPGPTDSWAGDRPHAFTVLFNIESLPPSLAGEAEVRLLLYDSHSQNPPLVEVDLNGAHKAAQTVRGAGDASIIKGGPGRPSVLSFKFPADRLHKGINKVEIRNVRGSWFLYDAVRFLAPPGVRLGTAPAFYKIAKVFDTILLRRRHGRPTQVARLEIIASADKPTSASIRAFVEGWGPADTVIQTTTIRPGKQWVDVDVPRLSGWPAKVTVALSVEGAVCSTATTTLRPHRRWTVYLVPHSHVDIGYTDVQTKILEFQKQNIRRAMEFAEKHPEYKGDARFCWNTEVLWAVKDFLRTAPPADRERFVRHVKNGEIGLDALFGNELTGLCSPEEMVHLIGFAGRLARDYSLEIDSAMITDVPGYSWGLVAVLANAGVKYLDMGPNADARIGTARRAWQDRPFYWVAPDGRSKVLTWLAPFGYYRMFGLLEKPQNVQQLLSYLHDLENNPNYPYDLVHIRMCTGDNGPPPFSLCDFVRDWNERYESPHFVIGRARDAFIHLEKKFADKIPEYAGDFTPYWEDGAASSADETARARRAAKALVAAEKIWSAAVAASPEQSLKPPLEEFDRAWDNVILYDEHTWGAYNSISEPDSPFVHAQWKIKQAFALDAEKQSAALVREGLARLAHAVPTGPDREVLVFNPSSWRRTDIARVELPSDEPVALVDAKGRAVATRRKGRVLTFIARDVPPLGYRTYRLAAPEKAGKAKVRIPSLDLDHLRVEGRFFALDLDAQAADVRNLVAPRRWFRRRRLVARDGFDRFIYCRDGDPKKISFPKDAKIEKAEPDSPDGAAVVIRSKAPGCKSLVQKVEIHGELPWIDITETLDRGDVRQAEGLYFDFPFDGLKGGRLRFDTAWAPVRIEDDLLPGACKNWFTIQHWVEVSTRRQTALLCPIDAPLIEIGEIHPNTRRHILPEISHLKLDPPRVLSFVMNNYWFTNYRASQPGKTSFRYRLYRYCGPSDLVRTTRCGFAAREPFRTVLLQPGNKGLLPGDEYSFLRVKPDNVIVTTVSPAQRGGTLVRLYEVAGKKAKVRLVARGFGRQAEKVDLWERPIASLEMDGDRIRLEMGPHQIVTVRIFR